MLSLLLTLYWTFTKIGLFTIGGGYAMLPLMEAEVIKKLGWLTPGEFLDIIAIAEATPGPVSINAATFVGYQVAGLPGSLLATLGIITPSLVILLLLGRFLLKIVQTPRAKGFLQGLKPALIALILLAAFNLSQSALIDLPTVIIAVVFFIFSLLLKPNPIYLIIAGAILGLILFPG